MRLIRASALLLAFSMPVAPIVAQVSADPARARVQALCDGLIAAMKAGKSAGPRGRAATIAPVVDRAFDLPLMTRLVVGTGWSTIAPADQTALVAAFRRMTIAQYAANFDGFSGERFAVDPKVEARGGDRLVRTSLIGSGAPVAIAYRLRQTGGAEGGWRIIDIFYRDSISQLATRRADFARILQGGGAKALIRHLDAQSAKAGG